MNILIIGYVWPEPNSSAAGSNMLSLIKLFLQQGWKVTFASPAEISPHMINLKALDVSMQNIKLNCSSFDNFVKNLDPSLVLFDRFMMQEQFAWRVEINCPNAIRILDTEDLHFLRNARHNALKQNREMTHSDLVSDLAKREIAAILRSDLSLILSEFELKLLQQQFKVDPNLLHHSPFMLPKVTSTTVGESYAKRTNFIFIGSFRHAPNWDAILWLNQEIWPKIRKKLPNAEIHVCGSYPPKKATQLHSPKTGFIVKGWVEDAQAEMKAAKVCLAPLRFGAGIKGKLVDAMQAGTPSVTTTIGSEAMSGTLPWAGFVENNVENFVNQAVSLYSNEHEWTKAHHNGFRIIDTLYDGKLIGRSLINKINALQSTLEQHRRDNFYGAMLRHHSMKSTQYMSQWIEEKNKQSDL